jgi:hypothetical protein
MKVRRANGGREDPHTYCMPPNFPRAWTLPQHTRVVQTPGMMVLLHEFNGAYREIYLDGRPLPVNPNPTWNGYSTGHWEGDTLVIETNGIRDDMWLDLQGSPITESARVTERIKRPSFGIMQVEIAVNDPKAYTAPWSVTIEMARAGGHPDARRDLHGQRTGHKDVQEMKTNRVTYFSVLSSVVVFCMVLVPLAWAHHSQSEYDSRSKVEVEGKVTQVGMEKPACVDLCGCDQREGRDSELGLRTAEPCDVNAPRLDPGFIETRRPYQSWRRSSAQLPGRRHRKLHQG